MRLSDHRVPARQSHEAFGKIINAVVAPQERDFTDRAVGQWRSESLVHQLDEMWPRWRSDIELQPMLPQLRVVGEVEARIRDTSILRSAPHAEVAFAPV
jgi:hypothetical protein